MKTIRLTLSQALVRHLAALQTTVEQLDGSTQMQPWCAGVFAIFGHGNVAGLGEALAMERTRLPTFRAHNEQGMAHAAIAFGKATFRQRIMAATSSIGPGATNMLTAAAVAHVNRLPLLLLPGDVFATRRPDPVLQQIEPFYSGDLSVNDCFRTVSRYFDRITRPEQILSALPRAMQVLSDPAQCGPVCIALPQDVQTMAFDCPEAFLHPTPIVRRRIAPDHNELQHASAMLRKSKRPLIIAGGGVLYSLAWRQLRELIEACGIPCVETHGGKSSLAWDHALNAGAIGVDGVQAANTLAAEADLIFAIGTRLQDFTTGSHALFAHTPILSLNVQVWDAAKWGAHSLVADARVGLQLLLAELTHPASTKIAWQADPTWTAYAKTLAKQGINLIQHVTRTPTPAGQKPYDAEVIGAVQGSAEDLGLDSSAHDVVVCAAGTLPAELHKLWQARLPGNYHVEYGYSCMGYEIAGGVGVRMARPQQEVIVLVGDGSFLMLNAELATSILLGKKIIVVILDNRGFGCIQRLQTASGGERFNNLLDDCIGPEGEPSNIDFVLHAQGLGADAVKVADITALRSALVHARNAKRSQVIVIETTHTRTTEGGCWWEVAIPEVSKMPSVQDARKTYELALCKQRLI